MTNFKDCIVPTCCLTAILLYCLLLGHIKSRWILQEDEPIRSDSTMAFYVGSFYKMTVEKLQ